MIVVSNTSPIINLAAIGQLELLQHIYDRITIPQAVYHEIAVRGYSQAGATEIQTYHWFERHQTQARREQLPWLLSRVQTCFLWMNVMVEESPNSLV